jgi:hypothetical protein
MPDPLVIQIGTCYALFAYEVAYAVDLDAAERRVAAERQTVKEKRRAPADFEYRPPPLRVTLDAAPVAVLGRHRTAAAVEAVLYDFGAVSLSYAIPIEGPLADLPALSAALWGHAGLAQESRALVTRLLGTLGDAAARPRVAEFVEDYVIFEIQAFAEPGPASALWTEHASTVAQILRAEPGTLSQQEIADATASRLSFRPDDATFIDTDATLLFDPAGEDVRAVIEFANTQLLEMRFLDQRLDEAIERSYAMLARRGRRLLGRAGPDLRRLGRLQLDSAVMFEQVTNALKLIGEQYLTRVYGLASQRFHLQEWDASITRKLETLDSIYAKLADQAAARRMELLEWVIIVLITVSILLPFLP